MSSRQEIPSYKVDKQGNYHFYATSKDDKIHVYRQNGQVNVRINNRQMTLSPEQAKNMSIYAGAGDDKVVLGRGLPPGIKVYTGPGNDKIINRSNGVTINGGSGRNTVSTASGNRVGRRGGRRRAMGRPRRASTHGGPRNVAAGGRTRTSGVHSSKSGGAAHGANKQQKTKKGSKVNGWDIAERFSPPDPVSRTVSKGILKITKKVVSLFRK